MGVGEERGPSRVGSEEVGVRKREGFRGKSRTRRDGPALSQRE